MSEKREDYINWDEYFIGVAKLSARRSKDPNTQVGACIVSEDNKILSMDTTDFREDAQMKIFHGEKNSNLQILIMQSICIPHTVN